MTVEEEIKHILILYRMGEYNEEKTVKNILSIPELFIKDPDQNVRRPNWREGDLLRGWEIAVKYLRDEYNWIKMLPKEEK